MHLPSVIPHDMHASFAKVMTRLCRAHVRWDLVGCVSRLFHQHGGTSTAEPQQAQVSGVPGQGSWPNGSLKLQSRVGGALVGHTALPLLARAETKHQWARDDPAFVVISCMFLAISGTAYCIA